MSKPVLFIDCGDTLCDESTEVRDVPGGVVREARLFPGAAEAIKRIHAMGVPIVLVADGLEASFETILRDVRSCFSGWVTSESVGEEKPSPRMFEAAMETLSLKEADKPRILMVGNNVRKDIVGANRFGLVSVLADYSPRYDMAPRTQEQVPQYRLHDIRDLPALVQGLMETEVQFTFRYIRPEEVQEAADVEQICFPPHEACAREDMVCRAKAAPDFFLVAIDRRTGRMAGFLNGLATKEQKFRDEFFTDPSLHDPTGGQVLLLGLDVRPQYRRRGLGRALVAEYARREKEKGRTRLVLTCLEDKVGMYESFGFSDLGMSDSVWGGEAWHEMDLQL